MDNKAPLYCFSSHGYLTTMAFRADLFKNLRSANRENDAWVFYNHLQFNGDPGILRDEISYPIVYRYIEGKRLRDILDTRCLPVPIISNRLKCLLEENDVTGWKTYPIVLFDKHGNEIPGYHGFTVMGRGGDSSSTREPYKRNLKTYYHTFYHWDARQWDGSDIFAISGGIYITERVLKILKLKKIDAIDIYPIDEHFKTITW